MTTNLSVNINKVATLRNARGENVPDVSRVAVDCEAFGADGITVHPRPDERHIRREDVFNLRPLVKTEFNIEGYPSPEFMDLVLKIKPEQVTLVPAPIWSFSPASSTRFARPASAVRSSSTPTLRISVWPQRPGPTGLSFTPSLMPISSTKTQRLR